MMHVFFSYLRSRLPVLVLYTVCAAIFTTVCFLMGAPLAGVGYAALLYAAVLAACLAVDLPRFVRRHRDLQSLMQKRLYAVDELPAARGLIEQDWRALLTLAARQSADLMSAYEQEQRERETYSALWTHQIKVPITAMRLLLADEPSDRSLAVGTELFRIEQYVDMALGYARLNGSSSDFVIRECSLEEIMRKSARRFAPLFIQKKLRLELQGTALRVLTDEKWLAFVLEQLLSNAVKYTQSGAVTLHTQEETECLIVEDTGIGIAPEDLPRVFEHGFTGLNGRMDKRATGLGLYLCKRILDKLGHRISIASQVGRGTCVTICLKQTALEAE